jgi:hypothetical protein
MAMSTMAKTMVIWPYRIFVADIRSSPKEWSFPTEVLVKGRPPRHQLEAKSIVDHGEAT